jgi:D-amino-acid dehydrogenase
MVTTDVLVVGAGVVGAATAYELARRGVDVTAVDAGAGCSYANAGLLAPSHVEPLTTPANLATGAAHLFRRDSPFHVTPSARIVPWLARFALASWPARARALTATMQRLARASLARHRAYAGSGMDTGFRQDGSLDVFLDARRLPAGGHVLSGRVLGADAARELEPGLGALAGAVHHADDATCETQALVRASLAAAVAHGARVRWNVRVDALRRDGDRLTGADTSAGPVSAGAVVVASGLDAGALTAPLGVRLPLLAGKGYVVDVPVQGRPRLPITFTELKVVTTPYPDRLRLCGTMDLGDASERLVADRVEAICRAAARGLPGVDTSRRLQVWAGRRPCTADGIPIIGRSGRVPNLHVAAGHGMWGMVLAPSATAGRNPTSPPHEPTCRRPDRR